MDRPQGPGSESCYCCVWACPEAHCAICRNAWREGLPQSGSLGFYSVAETENTLESQPRIGLGLSRKAGLTSAGCGRGKSRPWFGTWSFPLAVWGTNSLILATVVMLPHAHSLRPTPWRPARVTPSPWRGMWEGAWHCPRLCGTTAACSAMLQAPVQGASARMAAEPWLR